MTLKTVRNIIIFLSIIIFTFGTGYRAGSLKVRSISEYLTSEFNKKETPNSNIDYKNDFTLFWDVWDKIKKSYIDKKAINFEKMYYGAISGMVSSLGDPYTVFLPPDQNKEAKDELGGHFEGIGAQLGVKDKKIVVIAPLKGTPADLAGLKPGDWILKVDNEDTNNWTLPYAISKIRGPKGTQIALSILHKEATQPAQILVKRDTIKVASVEWEKKQNVIHLKLRNFGDQTASEWEKAVSDISKILKSENYKGIILDLRNNPGGYLSGSVFIASEFLSSGLVVIQENAKGEKQKYEVNRQGKLLDVPLIVLINKGSASATEIVAGALQDLGRAKLVGETSFGKGSIQESQDLPQGAGLHITIAKWLLPSGKWINGTGVKPDVEVENDDNSDSDLQLEKAIELLIK